MPFFMDHRIKKGFRAGLMALTDHPSYYLQVLPPPMTTLALRLRREGAQKVEEKHPY